MCGSQPSQGRRRLNTSTPLSHRSTAARWLPGAAALVLLTTTCGQLFAETEREYCERQTGPARVVCLRDLPKDGANAPIKAAPASPAPPTAATPSAGGARPAAPATPGAAVASSAGLYQVVDGYHVDPATLKGFQTWRAAACDRCHGANQEGLVGPSLVNSLKTLSKADFVTTVTQGRLANGMPSFAADKNVVGNIDQLYAYLKGRSDGAITKSHVVPIE